MLISQWLDTCTKEHINCQHELPSQLPTRVIDVGSPDGSQNPYLMDTRGVTGPYVALSHCWGPPTVSREGFQAQTLMSSLQKMQHGISIALLPQNFKDAITVVRKLHLRYLWIDSLCIIQDSKSDWEREAAQMNNIYRSSHLTLAATLASTSHDGFLRRSRTVLPPVRMPYGTSDDLSIRGKFYVSYNSRPLPNTWFEDIECAAWNQRGWTFQERLLSTRILHFCPTKLYWECRTENESEENEPAYEVQPSYPWIGESGVVDRTAYAIGPDIATFDRRYEGWYDIVNEYVSMPIQIAMNSLANEQKILKTPANL